MRECKTYEEVLQGEDRKAYIHTGRNVLIKWCGGGEKVRMGQALVGILYATYETTTER